MMNFTEYLRKKIKLTKDTGLYLFVNEKHLTKTGLLFLSHMRVKNSIGEFMGELYSKYAKEDNFLYITISDKEDKG